MSIAATYLQDLRAQYPSQLDRNELRITQTGLVTMALEMTGSASSIVSGDLLEKARNSEGRTLAVPVMTKNDITITNVRTCTIAADESNSAFVNVVWTTLVANIVMTPQQYKKNEIRYMEDLNKKIRETVEKLLVTVEEALDTALDTNKTQVYGSTIVGDDFALAGGAIQVPSANADYFFNYLDPINYADDFYDTEINVIASHALMAPVNQFINQGAGNSENKTFQFAGKNFRFSNRVTNGAGKKSTFYFMPGGSLGLLTRVDGDSRDGSQATDGTVWFEDILPGMPFPVGIRYKSECKDESGLNTDTALGHLTATLKEYWQISFDFGIVTPYNSDPANNAGAIRKVEFVA